MSAPYVPLMPAEVGFNTDGKLYSPLYGDVYHCPAGAAGQAQHVFLHGNGVSIILQVTESESGTSFSLKNIIFKYPS